ncbi:antitoxin Xre-like helix-turn-helix domain-containing protein [Halomonas sp. JS92-SW72]|uniref:type II RES/Xre toxin-antitoxin system antitoxin n=1 Tax=Halomonas sp. JS92-SW72 TaxID=2306583 RepID=UPI001F08DAC3|nr:antitoxin Xre-like helix-turn-helix domain-containing protein [Halomonas sp. JS92-SW72]
MEAGISEYRPEAKPPQDEFWKALGLPSARLALHEAVKEGVPYSVYTKLAAASGLESRELAQYVVISSATLRRRAKAGRFRLDEGDRLYRFAVVYKSAIELFEGDRELARRWILNPVQGLDGRRPVEMVTTTVGTKAILDLIGRLEHGVFP